MQKTFYCITLAASLLICEIGAATRTFASPSPTIMSVPNTKNFSVTSGIFENILPQDPLTTPTENTEYPVDQNNIRLELYSSNDRGVTEIYRSRLEGSGYVLVGTIPYDEWLFEDNGLNVRTTYYYKWRAVDGGETSPFSAPLSLTTLSINYWPTLTSELIDANTIRLTLTDNSMNDERYFIDEISASPTFNAEISMLDSGRTVTFDHDGVQAGQTYRYKVWMITQGDEEITLYDGPETEVQVPGSSGCTGAGTIEREVWTNVSGTTVASIPVNETPDQITELTLFETPNYSGNSYGARVRGYVCPPQDGSYTFYIASDDASELYLSTNHNPLNKTKIASVSGYTQVRQWDKYATQKSAAVYLEAGTLYYIEALHKESGGADHLAVGWQLPDGSFQRPIAGNRLVKFDHPPVVTIASPNDGASFSAGSTILIKASVSDKNNNVKWVDFERNGSILFRDNVAPYEFNWQNARTGIHALTATAYDGLNFTTADTVTISVNETCAGTGTIRQEFGETFPGPISMQ